MRCNAYDSNHRYLRLPAYHALDHLWFAVPVPPLRLWDALSADFTELMTLWLLTAAAPLGGLEQAFQGVTPSFHLLNNQFYETIFSEAPFNLHILAPRLTFSVRNVLHRLRDRRSDHPPAFSEAFG